jgi:hypothetical protein
MCAIIILCVLQTLWSLTHQYRIAGNFRGGGVQFSQMASLQLQSFRSLIFTDAGNHVH